MTCTDKIILVFIIVQVAVVLAKPNEPENDDGLNQFSDDMDNSVYKRASIFEQLFLQVQQTLMELTDKLFPDCGSGCEPEGCFSRKCRSSCRSGERHISMYDYKCSGGVKCCMCHNRWSNCRVG
ncbi:uncharacterized protein LOC144662138 isoform X3 [Oculina patagonica]